MAANLAQGLSPVRAELANGGVVLVQETVMTPAVTISASFRAGSMFDPVELPGLAYLTGRAIDRGTERRTASMMADELDERGVTLRVSSNRQALTVSCTCLAEDFDDVLAIVADVVRYPTFPPAEIENRRSEALTILRAGSRCRTGTPLRVGAPLRAAAEGHSARRRIGVAHRHGRVSCGAGASRGDVAGHCRRRPS
jgi:predicted Zn-dependent peptidase